MGPHDAATAGDPQGRGRERGRPPLPDLEFMHPSRDLNLYVYPQVIDYIDRRPLDPSLWRRLDSSVRATDGAFEFAPKATLDIDASVSATRYDPTTDGLLLLRYLFGFTGPALTSVDVRGGQQGEAMIAELHGLITRERQPQTVIIEPQLVVRDSTRHR